MNTRSRLDLDDHMGNSGLSAHLIGKTRGKEIVEYTYFHVYLDEILESKND